MSIKILTIGAAVYLGTLKEDDKGTITIKNSLCIGNASKVEKHHLASYIKAKHLGSLEKDITIRGTGSTFSERALSDDLALEFQILDLKFEQAKKLAPGELVNSKFDFLIGG